MEVKLVIPDIQPDLENLELYNRRVSEIAGVLLHQLENSKLLNEDSLWEVLDDTSKYPGKTFIVPGTLVGSRQHMTKINRLTTYLFHVARKLDWSFVIIAPNKKAVDLRIRDMITEEEEWS